MPRFAALLPWLVPIVAVTCSNPRHGQPEKRTARTVTSLVDARRGFTTTLIARKRLGVAAPRPPAGILDLVTYPTALGPMAAYLSPRPASKARHPVIIWVYGTFRNSIGSFLWETVKGHADMTARAFREAGIVTMYPSTRGGNDNPGYVECLYGELDDILAARRWLLAQPWVDPARIYLGGHSTGGTMALLLGEASTGFRAIVSIGPAASTEEYGAKSLTYDTRNPRENELRNPSRWLHLLKTPTYVFEGTRQPTNIDVLAVLRKRARDTPLLTFPVTGEDHFSCIAPVTQYMARAFARDTDTSRPFTLDLGETRRRFPKKVIQP